MKLPDNFPTEEELLNIIMHTATTAWNNELYEQDIQSWLKNFVGEVYNIDQERLLGLWLLSHFTYYNKEEVTHLCKVLFGDLLHHVIRDKTLNNAEISSEVEKFFSESNIISPGSTSDSGGFIAYFFRQENDLPMKLFNFSVHNVDDKIKNLLIIDDVTLTANMNGQASAFFKKAREIHPTKNFILLTLVANEEAIKFLKEKFDVQVISAIILDKRDKCFSEHSDLFSSFPQLIPVAEKFARHYGKKTHPGMEIGYMDGQYTFGFFYNTPDNTLPIFWGKTNNWVPVLKRYHKNYHTSNYLRNERFI
jgi:hypothetical protein